MTHLEPTVRTATLCLLLTLSHRLFDHRRGEA